MFHELTEERKSSQKRQIINPCQLSSQDTSTFHFRQERLAEIQFAAFCMLQLVVLCSLSRLGLDEHGL